MSPALARGFLTPEPPGKLPITLFVFTSVWSPIQNDIEEVKIDVGPVPCTDPAFFSPFGCGAPRCSWWAFSSCSQWRLLFVELHGLLVVTPLAEEHGLQAHRPQ